MTDSVSPQVCPAEEAVREIIPEQCADVMAAEARLLPGTQHVRRFSLKHARQQGAILGHMDRLGMLQARAA